MIHSIVTRSHSVQDATERWRHPSLIAVRLPRYPASPRCWLCRSSSFYACRWCCRRFFSVLKSPSASDGCSIGAARLQRPELGRNRCDRGNRRRARRHRLLDLPVQTDRWPRNVHAELIAELDRRGAAVIALDIAFKEPRSRDEDQPLASAIQAAGNVVLFKYLQRSQHGLTSKEGDRLGIMDLETEVPPIRPLRNAAAAVGTFTLPKTPLRVNKTKLYTQLTEGVEANLVLAVLQVYSKALLPHMGALFAKAAPGVVPADLFGIESDPQLRARAIHAGFTTHPALPGRLITLASQHTDPSQRQQLIAMLQAYEQRADVYINFYGPERTVATIGYDQVLGAPGARELVADVQGKIVFVGLSEWLQTEQSDSYTTVFTRDDGVDLSGVEIAATVTANLLEGRPVKPFPGQPVLLLAMTILLFLVALSGSLKQVLVIQMLIAAAYALLAHHLFARYALWLPLATPLAVLLFTSLAALGARYVQSSIAGQAITDALSHYLPREAAQQLSQDIRQFQEQYSDVKGVCLMTDIQGYTAISEQLSPSDLHRLMNNYYAKLVEQVKIHDGTVANIVGDSLLAIWTAKELDRELCSRVCNAALSIAQVANEAASTAIPLPTSVAVHGGSFSLGNLGGGDHFEYSPVGDIVNTSSRIEGQNRTLRTRILTTDIIAQGASGFVLRNLGDFPLKNKQAPLCLHELLGHDADISPETRLLVKCFREALGYYQQRDYVAALNLFDQLVAQHPDDGPSLYYRARCEQFLSVTQSPRE